MQERREHSRDQTPDWWQAGIYNAEAGNYREALVCFDKCLTADLSATDCHFMKAACLVERGRLEEANSAIDDYLEQETEVAAIWSLKATVHAKLNELDTAVAACDVAVETSEAKEPKYLHQQGLFLLDLGRNAEALENYDKILQLVPEKSLGWMNKGLCLFQDEILTLGKVTSRTRTHTSAGLCDDDGRFHKSAFGIHLDDL